MADANQAIQDWYTKRLHQYYTERYRAYLANEDTEDPATELSTSAVYVERADHGQLPEEVRAAHAYYWKHFEETDLGSARVYRVSAGRKATYAIRVKTDGDDGFLEVYDKKGTFLAAARTYLEVLAWGNRDWLREQAPHPWDLPPELQGASQRTLWGKPVAGVHCCETCDHACTVSPPGCCIEGAGHLQADDSPHRCSQCGFAWGGTPKPPAPPVPEEPKIAPWLVEIREIDGSVYTVNLREKEITLLTDDGRVVVPVADVLQIDFAPREKRRAKKGAKKAPEFDVVSTLNSTFTGKIESDTFQAIYGYGDSPMWFDDIATLVNRTTLERYANAVGTRLDFRLRGRVDGLIYGTKAYTLDSCVATTAVHAGVLQDGQIGVVKVEIIPSPASFGGSIQNGVTSETWDDAQDGAYRFRP